MSRMFIALAAAASVMTFAAGAQAHPHDQREPDQRTISVRHVDFSNASQTRAYYARIQAAAHAVCTSEVSDPLTADADRACERQAIHDAVRQVGAPELSRLDDSKGNRTARSAPMLASNDR